MPYLHCIATKCSLPPSKKFPWFFSSALPRDISTIFHRSLTSVTSHTSTFVRRKHHSQSNNVATGVLIAGIIIAALGLILSAWGYLWLRHQREHLYGKESYGQGKANRTDYWVGVEAPMPPPAYGYEMNSIMPTGPYATPAEAHYRVRPDNHWNASQSNQSQWQTNQVPPI
jgi:hypothetical protein